MESTMAKKTTKKTRGKKVARKTTRTKSPAPAGAARRSDNWKERDEKTAQALRSLAESVVKSALSGREPKFEVPTRSASNTKWNKSRGILQMGSATNTRQLF
ncbi:MAG: hypothetical protein D6695_01790, partial [Planctomycetota bacterium]